MKVVQLVCAASAVFEVDCAVVRLVVAKRLDMRCGLHSPAAHAQRTRSMSNRWASTSTRCQSTC